MARAKKAKISHIGKRRVAAKNENSEYYSEKRQAMLSAAATLFKEKGLNGTSLDEVAQLAGIDRSTLYYYVSNRQELFFEICGDAMERLAVKAEEILEQAGTPAQKFEKLLVAQMVSYAENYPHLYVFLQEKIPDVASSDTPQKVRLLDLSRRFEKVFRTIVNAGVADGTFRDDLLPTIMSYAAIGMSNWTHRWFEPNRLLSGEEVGKAFATIMLNGIRAGK
jgi:AcrR family transcriptional regulator